MKKQIKKIWILVLIVLCMIVAGIIIVNNYYHNTPLNEDNSNKKIIDNETVKYINNIEGIEIESINLIKKDKDRFITIQVYNTTQENKFDVPISIEFVNIDSDTIFKTGYVQDVLLKGMKADIYAKITPQIETMIKEKQIDHIIITK